MTFEASGQVLGSKRDKTTGQLYNVPELPLHFLPRSAELAQLKAAILAAACGQLGAGPIVITGAARSLGRAELGPGGMTQVSQAEGMGGIGKSVLAAALARDREVQGAFPDGVIWLTLGPRPALTAQQACLARAITGRPQAFENAAEGEAWLGAHLRDKACLVILDDVWEIEHLEAFAVLGPPGCLLFTTRDNGPLVMLGTMEQQVAVLDDASALTLLAAWAEQPVDALPPEALEIAHECGKLPLLLAMMGALLQGKPGLWGTARRQLREVDQEQRHRQLADTPYPEVWRVCQVCVNALGPDLQKRYLDLAVFPENTPIPEAALQTLWALEESPYQKGLDAKAAQEVIATLARRALVQRDAPGCLHLHELQREYVRKHIGNWPARHTRLLRAYQHALEGPAVPALRKGATASAQAQGKPWLMLPRDEPYLWRHLAYHLVEAGQAAELGQLLLDFNWLQAQLEATDIITLRAAYMRLPLDENLRLVHDALRLATPVLLKDPAQLAGQLSGRLLYLKSPPLRGLLRQALRWKATPWLRPLTASLRRPGGPLERTLTGHRDQVRAVAVTSDGLQAVSGAADGRLKVWSLAQGLELCMLAGHRQAINAVTILDSPGAPAGRRVISASEDGLLKVWDLERRTEIATLKEHAPGGAKGRPARITGLTVTPDRGRAISASFDGTLKVWDLERGTLLRIMKGHPGPVWSVVALPDGRHVLAASDDGRLRVWDMTGGAEVRTLAGHPGEIYTLAVTPDGRRAISGSLDTTLKVWNLEQGTIVHTLKGHAGPIRAVAVTPDSQWIISASDDGTLKIWDLERGIERCTLAGHQAAVLAVTVTWDGRAISASADRTLKVWNLEHGADLHTLTGHRDAVNAIAVLPDGERVVSVSDDRTLKIWGLQWRKAALRVLTGHSRNINAVAVSRDGRRAVSASQDRTLKVWDLEQGQELGTLAGHGAPVKAVAMLPDGHRAISGSSDRTLKVWDLAQGRVLSTLSGHQAAVTAVAVIQGGRAALSASADGTLKVWDLAQGIELRSLVGYGGPLLALAAGADGQWAISGGADGTLQVWDLTRGVEQRTLAGHQDQVTAAAVTADGQYLVSGSSDCTVRVWDLAGGRVLACFTGESAILSVAAVPEAAPAGRPGGPGVTVIAGEKSGRIHFLRLEADFG